MVLGRKTIANRLSRYVLLISAGLLLVVTLLVGIFSREIIEGGSTEIAGKSLDLAIRDIEKVLTVWAGSEPTTAMEKACRF